jgi:hypothetical protein
VGPGLSPAAPGLSPYPPPAAPGLSPYPPPAPTWDPRGRPPTWLASQAAAVPAVTSRPTFREPLPVRGGRVAGAAAVTSLWMGLMGMLAGTLRSYGWYTIIAALLAWGIAFALARYGDRGAAVGTALASALGLAIATLMVIARWAGGDWPLW